MADDIVSTSDQGTTDAATGSDDSAVLSGQNGQESGEQTGDVLSGTKTDDGKTEEGKSDDGKTGEGEKKEQSTEVPESYDLKAPENFQIDEKQLDYWSPVFKDMGLTNEQAQAFVNAAPEYLTNMVSEAVNQQVNEFQDIQKQQFAELQKDAEFGGKNWNQTQLDAKAALNQFATPEEIEYIADTGQQNSPALIRIFARIGKEMADSKLGTGAVGNHVTADSLYPNSKMNP